MRLLNDLVHMPTKARTEPPSSLSSSLLSGHPFSNAVKISSMPTLGLPKELYSIPKPPSIDFQAASPHPFIVATPPKATLTLSPAVTSLVHAPAIPSVKPAVPELASTHIPIAETQLAHIASALTPPVKFNDNPLSLVPDIHLGSVISHVNPNDFLSPNSFLPRVETPRIDLPRSVVNLGDLFPTRPRDDLPTVKPPRIDFSSSNLRVDLADLTPTRLRPNDSFASIPTRQAADESAHRAAQMAFQDAMMFSTPIPLLTPTTLTSRVSSNPTPPAADVPEEGTAFSAQTYAKDAAENEVFFEKESRELALNNRNIEHAVMTHESDVYRSQNEYLTSVAEQLQSRKQRWAYKPSYDKPVLHLPLTRNFKTSAPVAQYA